ncbi:predicted protein, partial [Nematostella vectensis]
CKLCRRKGDAEKMLLCDACDRGHHMYCLKPPIKHIPEGNWFCPDCRPKEPRRGERRRKVPAQEESDTKGKQKPGSATKKTKPKQDSSKKKRKRSPSPPTSASPDSSRSPSPVRKATARRDPRLAGRLLKCEKLLTELMEHEDADPFVGSTGRGKVKGDIAHALDGQSDRLNLATIQKKLTSSQYGSIDEFLEDVRKVFINCAERSRPRSKETKAGARLSAFFETKFSDM